MSARNLSSVDIFLQGDCGLRCPVCDCGAASRQSPDAFERALQNRPDQIVLRGGAERARAFASTVRQANEAGIEVVLRTNAIAFRDAERAQKLAALGVRAVRVPAFSANQRVHDRITGSEGSLVASLVGLRALVAAGLHAELEIPLLPERLQDLGALLDLFVRAAPALRRVRVYLPTGDLPPALAPPPWDVATDRLVALLERCKDAGIHVQIDGEDAIPLCALAQHETLWPAFHFNPKREARVVDGATFLEPCARCATQPQCTGVVRAYAQAHRGAGLRPFRSKPKALYEQRTTPKPRWTEERKQAASERDRLVLRPTVNCNQDCPFCSANETSASVWADHGTMLRKIARAGRAGVKWLSFSGGEPTLSKYLTGYIRTARRVGIEEVELVTNGTLLNEQKVKELAEAGLNYAFVSLHAHTEEISQAQTRKVGDWARTVRAVEMLVDAKVKVQVNHVINSRNFRYLRRYIEFLHGRFGGKVPVSFAFITPQYQALEQFDLVPRLSDVMPYLRDAMHRAVELGQPFIVGSRQGIPPCFLREFQAWSDFWVVTNEAAAEDSYQKARGEVCGSCRYTNFCTGLWRPYIDHYGFGELVPVRGEPFTREQLAWGHPDPFRVFDFEQVHPGLRDHDAEREYAESARIAIPDVVAADPEIVSGRSRPLRVQLAGTGNRGRIIARDLFQAGGMTIDAVSSPHAPDGDLLDFGNPPAYRDSVEAMDELRPEALIVATNTATHLDHIRAARERGIPCLVEKPLTTGTAEADELRGLLATEGALVMPAHQVLYATGIDAIAFDYARDRDVQVRYVHKVQRGSSDALRTWHPESAYQGLYHALVIVGRATGGGLAEVTDARAWGEVAPERIELTLRYPRGNAHLNLDYTANEAQLRVGVERSDGSEVVWWRRGREVTVTRDGKAETPESRGGEIQLMLAAFRDAAIGRDTDRLPTVEEALEIQANARAAVDALARVEPRFEGKKAVRHVSSREFRPESRR
jgi:MoaA/NifB/PqqE/SkfB family radical SAM enzyme/predicted dehydrogenase